LINKKEGEKNVQKEMQLVFTHWQSSQKTEICFFFFGTLQSIKKIYKTPAIRLSKDCLRGFSLIRILGEENQKQTL